MARYIVESYGADSVVADQRRRAEDAARRWTGVLYIRTTIVPGDETLLHVFEGPSADAIYEAATAAGLECDRIVEVLEAAPASAKELPARSRVATTTRHSNWRPTSSRPPT